MIDTFKQAKKNKDILLFENFQAPEITWEEILNFLFQESKEKSLSLPEDDKWGECSGTRSFMACTTNKLFI